MALYNFGHFYIAHFLMHSISFELCILGFCRGSTIGLHLLSHTVELAMRSLFIIVINLNFIFSL